MESDRSIGLDDLLRRLPQTTRVVGSAEVALTSLEIDSRLVQPGALFVALRGQRSDGHRFITQAAHRGAAAIVSEEFHALDSPATMIVVPDTARALSVLADAFYGMPSEQLHVAGVTGTNGKTTTTQMIASMLNEGGVTCGTIGTIGAHLGEREWPLANTTPLAPQLQELLAQMLAGGAEAVAMEVSSHALALARVNDVRFEVGALTNITRDHLDFHPNFEAYAAAKHKLFEQARACVLNADDEIGERWARDLRTRKSVTTYAITNPADVRAESLEVRPDGSTFEVGGQRFNVRLPGRFNVANALCALAVTRILALSDADAARGLARLERVPGRMEYVRGGDVDALVDYAHTPDALENVLRTCRELARGRLIAVFGCGGERDRGKRAQMGAVSARLADYTYVTSDNPRGEDPAVIARDIVGGVGAAPYEVQLDRRAAVRAAIAGAQPGDVVVIAGKGHETYQIIGERVLPFDDVAVAREALGLRTGAGR